MADEFAKGLVIATGAGLLWMVLGGWYCTPSFESNVQIIATCAEQGMFLDIALLLKDAMLWFAVFGMLAFWVVIPGSRQIRGILSGSEE